MMKKDSLDCLDIIESVWTHVLLNWLNKCVRMKEKLTDLNIEVLAEVTEKYSDDVFEGNRAVHNTYFLQNFMQVKYPQLKLRPLMEDTNPGLKCYIMTSVLLYYCCIESKSGAVDNDICKNLDKMEQELILRFCESLMAVDVTVDNVLTCIEDAYNRMHDALKIKTSKVYRARSRSLDSLPSTIYRDPSVRLLTSSDDTSTTLVPDEEGFMTSSINLAPSTYYYIKPRAERASSFCSFDDDIPQRCYIHSESTVLKPRRRHSASQSEYCIRNEVKIKERDTAVQKSKHTSGYVIHYPRKTRRIKIPRPFVLKANRSVEAITRSKHRSIKFSPNTVEPKRSDYRFDFRQPSIYRKKSSKPDVAISESRLIPSDKSILEHLKRDFSMETEFSDIPKDAQTNTSAKEEKKEKKEIISRTEESKKDDADGPNLVDKSISEHLRRDFSMETEWSDIPKDAETNTLGEKEKKEIISLLDDDDDTKTDSSEIPKDADESTPEFVKALQQLETIQVKNTVNKKDKAGKKSVSLIDNTKTNVKVLEDVETKEESSGDERESVTSQQAKIIMHPKYAFESLKNTLKVSPSVSKKLRSSKNVLRSMLKGTPGGSRMTTMSRIGLESLINRQKLTQKAFRKVMMTPECSKKATSSYGDGFRDTKNKIKANARRDRLHNLNATVLRANSQSALEKRRSSANPDLRKLRERLAMSPETAKKLKHIIDSSATDFQRPKSKLMSRAYLKDPIKSAEAVAGSSYFGMIPHYRASGTDQNIEPPKDIEVITDISMANMIHMETEAAVDTQSKGIVTEPKKTAAKEMIDTAASAIIRKMFSDSLITEDEKPEESRERCANSTSCSVSMNYIKTSGIANAISRSCDKCFPEEPSSNKSGIFGQETKFVGLLEPLYFLQPRRIALSVNKWFGEWLGVAKVIGFSALGIFLCVLFMFSVIQRPPEKDVSSLQHFKMKRDDTIKVYNTHNHFSSYWQCQNGVCKKIVNEDVENVQNLHRSYGVCFLRCMEPHLWPQPAGYVSYTDKNIVSSTSELIGYKLQTPSNEVSEYLHEAFKFFFNDLLRVENSYPKPKNDVFNVDEAAKKVVIQIVVNADKDPRLRLDTVESYKLKIEATVNSVQISITADSFCGARHGLETLGQLIVLDQYSGLLVLYSEVSIADTPVNRYRGLMLDTARNFIPVPDIIRTVDAMAACKLNTFHWRISDAASFPLKLERMPQLVEYGAYDKSMIYNQTDVQRVVDRAAVRGIRVLIEVAAPGPVGRAWAWSDEVYCSKKKTDGNTPCGNDVCTKMKITDSNLHVLQQIYEEIIAMTKVNDVIHLSNGMFSPLPCRTSFNDRGGFLDKVLERLKLANKGFMPKLPIIWFTKDLMNDSEASSWDKLGVQVHEFLKESTETVLSRFRLVHSTKWDLSCKMKNNWCHKFKTWQEMYNWNGWRNIRGLTIEGGEAILWTDLVNDESLDIHLWPRTAAVAERLWSDINVNTTVDSSVYLRLESHRWRMELRGINGRPIWPLWCTFDPFSCLQKLRSLR